MNQGTDQAASSKYSGDPVPADWLKWLLPTAILAIAAAGFTLVIRSNELLDGERALTRWFSELDVVGVRTVVDFLDFISGDTVGPVIFVLIITALTWVTDLASRPQPNAELEWTEAVFGFGGYPSGHVVYAVVVFGILTHLAGVYMKPGRVRFVLRVFLVSLIVTMGPARIIELDHWAMDVIGSYLLALPFLLIAIWVHPRLPGWLSGAPRFRALIGADRGY
jgi:membrane-associated phospholipid phosphatase